MIKIFLKVLSSAIILLSALIGFDASFNMISSPSTIEVYIGVFLSILVLFVCGSLIYKIIKSL